jgi:hypothetical protein
MSSKQEKSKGIVITLSAILEGLFFIGIMGFLYWFFLSRILELHVAIEEFTNERQTINLANLLISSEKIAHEKDGGIMRGVLDAEKLDSVFIKRTDFVSDVQALFQPIDIGIGYPNSINIVRVVDLEKCDSSGNCDGWIAVLSSPVTLQGLSITKFNSCLSEHVKLDLGSVFRWIFGGPLLGLWQPWDLKNCVQNTVPSGIKSVFTKSEIISSGFPVLIKYPDGELHVGRISVGVGEFI